MKGLLILLFVCGQLFAQETYKPGGQHGEGFVEMQFTLIDASTGNFIEDAWVSFKKNGDCGRYTNSDGFCSFEEKIAHYENPREILGITFYHPNYRFDVTQIHQADYFFMEEGKMRFVIYGHPQVQEVCIVTSKSAKRKKRVNGMIELIFPPKDQLNRQSLSFVPKTGENTSVDSILVVPYDDFIGGKFHANHGQFSSFNGGEHEYDAYPVMIFGNGPTSIRKFAHHPTEEETNNFLLKLRSIQQYDKSNLPMGDTTFFNGDTLLPPAHQPTKREPKFCFPLMKIAPRIGFDEMINDIRVILEEEKIKFCSELYLTINYYSIYKTTVSFDHFPKQFDALREPLKAYIEGIEWSSTGFEPDEQNIGILIDVRRKAK